MTAPMRIWKGRLWCWFCYLCTERATGADLPSWAAACAEAELHYGLYHSKQAVMCNTKSPP